MTCIFYHLYTAPLNFSLHLPITLPSFYLSTLLFPLQDDYCGILECESHQNVRQKADDLSPCLSEMLAERTWDLVGPRRDNPF